MKYNPGRKKINQEALKIPSSEIPLNSNQGDEIMAQQTTKKTTIKPLGNRVLVKRLEQEETLKGGIILPDTAKKKQEAAEVIAIGLALTKKKEKTLRSQVKSADKT